MKSEPRRLAELAERLGLRFEGDGAFVVREIESLESAGPADLVFVASQAWARALAESKAGAVLLPEGIDAGGRPAIRTPNPRLDFARAARILYPETRPAPGVHPSALIAPDAVIHPEATVGPRAVVGAGSVVGPRSMLCANVTLYWDVRVGADCEIHAGCVLREGTEIGDRVILQPGVVLGGDGLSYQGDEKGEYVRVRHLGRTVLEDDVEIGANATVDRATLGETRIGRSAKIDNLVVIAHNCKVGEQAMISAQSGLAGSTVVGRRAILMGQVGVADHLTIGDGAFIAGRAALHKDVPSGARIYGMPQMEHGTWQRVMAAMVRLPAALRRLRALERRLDAPEKKPETRG